MTPVSAAGNPSRDCASSPPMYSSAMTKADTQTPSGCSRAANATMIAAKP